VAIHRANLKKLRSLIDARRTVIVKAIPKLEAKIKAGRSAPAASALNVRVPAHRQSLADARKIIKALDEAKIALLKACCENDQNCDIDG
jgi:hypothetical protein